MKEKEPRDFGLRKLLDSPFSIEFKKYGISTGDFTDSLTDERY